MNEAKITELLKKAEWSGTIGGQPTGMGLNNGLTFPACIDCGRAKPSSESVKSFDKVGHKKSCVYYSYELQDFEELAQMIHERICTLSHTDGCGWGYENWENPGHSRSRYISKAKRILKYHSLKDALSVISEI